MVVVLVQIQALSSMTVELRPRGTLGTLTKIAGSCPDLGLWVQGRACPPATRQLTSITFGGISSHRSSAPIDHFIAITMRN